MSDQMTDTEDDQAEDNLARLREKADRGTKAERENILLRAGVDIDSDLGAMFARGYDGDMTKEAVQAAWVKIAPTPGTAPTSEPTDEEREAEADRLLAQQDQDLVRRSIGSTPSDPMATGTGDPVRAAWDQFHEDRRSGTTVDKASAKVNQAIIESQVAAGGWKGYTEEDLRP